jgi:hypothetical protein
VAGSPALEQQINLMLQGLRAKIDQQFGTDAYETIVITGGYGRGEGGVDWSSGQEILHNNLDLVWVTPGHNPEREQRIQRFLQHWSHEFQAQEGVQLDSFIIDAPRLRRLPCLVMLYDMREGHRVLAGPPDRLRTLIPYGVDDILPGDVRNLLINRGVLLLINDFLLRRGQPSPALRRQMIRHIIKATIGLGDALLFMRGEYHWSYQEKQRRMDLAVDIPSRLRKHYYQAASFRFAPDYRAYDDTDIAAWNQELLDLFQHFHLQFEQWRLKQVFDWEGYPTRAFEFAWQEDIGYRGMPLRKLKHLLQNQSRSRELSLCGNMGLRMLDNASLLALLFPVVAYQLNNPSYITLAQTQLNARPGETLLSTYLRTWGAYLDSGLLPRLEKWQQEVKQ